MHNWCRKTVGNHKDVLSKNSIQFVIAFIAFISFIAYSPDTRRTDYDYAS